ncbi:MAG: hypothetical protein JRN35_06095 [Nitrososphaerota archaeon]|nr:hypothetical protein [Nitrososphaerota archaeon]
MTDNGTLIAAALNGIATNLLTIGILGLLALLGFGLMVAAIWARRGALSWGAVLGWFLFGFFAYQQASAKDFSNAYYAMFWLGVLLGLVAMVESLVIKPRPQDAKEDVYGDMPALERASARLHRKSPAPRGRNQP